MTIHQPFSIKQIIFVFAALLVPLGAAVSGSFPLWAAVLPGAVVLFIMLQKKGASPQDVLRSIRRGVLRNRPIAWLLVFIGLLLPSWASAGIVSDLNDLFLASVPVSFFLTASFLIAGAMSLTVGSAIGSLSIVGIPLMSAGMSLGHAEVLLAGALVSGAFIGDRTSPLSSSFQLLAFAVELSPRNHFRSILPTLLVSTAVSAAVFALLDSVYAVSGETTGSLPPAGSLLVSLIPPLLLFILITAGRSMYTCFTSAIAAGVLLYFLRGGDAAGLLEAAFFGLNTINGLAGMLPFVLFILAVGAFCQMIEDAGMLTPHLERLFERVHSFRAATVVTVLCAAAVSLVSPNQSFPILLTGRTLLPHWRTHYSSEGLARILADSTVVFAGMVPWSLLAILCGTIVGVPPIQYVPAAVFLWISPAVTILWSFRRKAGSSISTDSVS
ncbi:Na+/H+ antiporter NhaC family protein [Alkalicoccus urumqiensis]|nr:Na+/H+ antiporter NhaC family protein [Alkalicoccus urumqiensis]